MHVLVKSKAAFLTALYCCYAISHKESTGALSTLDAIEQMLEVFASVPAAEAKRIPFAFTLLFKGVRHKFVLLCFLEYLRVVGTPGCPYCCRNYRDAFDAGTKADHTGLLIIEQRTKMREGSIKTYACYDCYVAKRQEYQNQRTCMQFDYRVSPEGQSPCTWGVDDADVQSANGNTSKIRGPVFRDRIKPPLKVPFSEASEDSVFRDLITWDFELRSIKPVVHEFRNCVLRKNIGGHKKGSEFMTIVFNLDNCTVLLVTQSGLASNCKLSLRV